MLLFWLKHYIPFRALGVLFGITKSTACRIIQEELERVGRMIEHYCSIDNFFKETPPAEFSTCYGIIDSTEFEIWSWKDQSFSGKKMKHTLKYQAVVGIDTGTLLHLYGPICGAQHDVEVYYKSYFYNWLQQNNGHVLGDKGYVGCSNIVTPYKKKGQSLTNVQQQYNLTLAKYRIKVENHFCHLKKWKVLLYPFRGNLKSHSTIVSCCEVLLAFEQ